MFPRPTPMSSPSGTARPTLPGYCRAVRTRGGARADRQPRQARRDAPQRAAGGRAPARPRRAPPPRRRWPKVLAARPPLCAGARGRSADARSRPGGPARRPRAASDVHAVHLAVAQRAAAGDLFEEAAVADGDDVLLRARLHPAPEAAHALLRRARRHASARLGRWDSGRGRRPMRASA